MASKSKGRRFLSDKVVNARRSPPKAPRVTIISGGMKYRDGQAVGRVSPASSVNAAVHRAIARPLVR